MADRPLDLAIAIADYPHTRYAYKQQLIPRRMSIGELLVDSENT